jgi:hypothetical protein
LGIAFFHFIVSWREWMRRKGEESEQDSNLNGGKWNVLKWDKPTAIHEKDVRVWRLPPLSR